VTSSFTLGSRESQHLTITVLRREHQGAGDYWDGNWVVSRIEARVGGFTADYEASLRTDEFHRFHEGLKFINDNLFGSAVFASMEGWVDLTAKCLPNGSLEVTGELCDQAGAGSGLTIELDGLDQTHLPAILTSLSEIEQSFPVLGRP
jgi:hypothetical protein